MKYYKVCRDQMLVESLDCDHELSIREEQLLLWIEHQLRDVEWPRNWHFTRSPAKMVLELTTIVYCEPITGFESIEEPVREQWIYKQDCVGDNRRVYPHVLFVSSCDSTWVVLGSLTSKRFYEIIGQVYGFVSYGDLVTRMTVQLFNNIHLFDENDYYFLRTDNELDMVPHWRRISEALVEKYCLVSIEEFTSTAPDEMAPYVFQYMLFVTSASDRLATEFTEYEVELLHRRLQLLELNPLLQLELVRKWLRVDWRCRPEALPQYKHSNNWHEIEVGDFLFDSFAYTYEPGHAPIHLLFTSHFLRLRPKLCRFAIPGAVCKLCGRDNCSRPKMYRGRMLMPLQCITLVALDRLRTYIHQQIQQHRRDHGTYEALKLWLRARTDVPIEDEVNHWAPLLLRYVKDYDPARDKDITLMIREHIRDSLEKRRNFKLLFDRDFLVLNNTIIPEIWQPMVDAELRPNKGDWIPLTKKQRKQLKLEQRPRRHRSRLKGFPAQVRNNVEDVNLDLPDCDALVEHARRYWPLCIQTLFRQCTGPVHLQYAQRLSYGRFLGNARIGYTTETILRIWFLTFSETDKFLIEYHGREDVFWASKHGTAITSMLQKPYENLYWPSCATQVKAGLCPFGAIEAHLEVKDIEDLVTLCAKTCSETKLADQRRALGLIPNSPHYRIYDPAETTVNLLYWH